MKRLIVLGADGYLGFPVSLHFANAGFEVHAVDNLSKRFIEARVGVAPLIPLAPFNHRFDNWNLANSRCRISTHLIDIATQSRLLYNLIDELKPSVIIHFAEQPSAPYSMRGRSEAVDTQINNISGTLNLAFAIKKYAPHCHIIKLGTMGEYGTPNIDIEEGWLDIEHNGRNDRVMFPKKANSFYHLSKVHDSNNLEFAARNWNLMITDLNQGIVYGHDTDLMELSKSTTSFHYDSIFGTVINRFMIQGLCGSPLTVYGSGDQIRAYLHISDVLKCIHLAVDNPPDPGEFRVRNQFTEFKSVNDLSMIVAEALSMLGLSSEISHIVNPRLETNHHYYNPSNRSFIELGLNPLLLTPQVVYDMLVQLQPFISNVQRDSFYPTIKWDDSIS